MAIPTVGVTVINRQIGEACGGAWRKDKRRRLMETDRAFVLDYEISGASQPPLITRDYVPVPLPVCLFLRHTSTVTSFSCPAWNFIPVRRSSFIQPSPSEAISEQGHKNLGSWHRQYRRIMIGHVERDCTIQYGDEPIDALALSGRLNPITKAFLRSRETRRSFTRTF